MGLDPDGATGISQDDSNPEVRSEELRYRSHQRPPLCLWWREAPIGLPGDAGEVVVLDDQHAGMLPEHIAQRRRSRGGQARTGRVVRAGGADHGAGTGPKRRPQPGHRHPLGVNRNRCALIAAEPQGSDARQEARVLHSDHIPASEMGSEQTFDRVHCSMGHDELVAPVYIGCHVGGRPLP